MPEQTHFIGEAITVEFDQPAIMPKRPPCPDRIIWDGALFLVIELVSEWRDYGRRGRMANNMRPSRIALATKRGSWGVGRYYFQVWVHAEGEEHRRLFEIYYDRAPKGLDQRQGSWFLKQELLP